MPQDMSVYQDNCFWNYRACSFYERTFIELHGIFVLYIVFICYTKGIIKIVKEKNIYSCIVSEPYSDSYRLILVFVLFIFHN